MTASPSPYQIKAFTFAARERSISNAAEALGVTQSSVTQHISKLEMLMGTQLFIRRRSGLELTRAGRELFAVSDRLATMEQLVSEKISDYSALTDGHIRLIANAPRPAMPIIAQYGRLHPKVQIDFTLYNWTTAMTLLGERQVDIAIVTEPDEGQSIVTHELRRSRYMAHIQKDHPLAGRQKISLADLQRETLVLPEDGSLTQKITRSKLRDHGLEFPRILRTTTFPMVKEAILHGLGIGLLLEKSLYPSEYIVAVPVEEMPEEYRDCLAIPADKRELRLIQSFLDAAIEVRASNMI
ncbi:HTH-type transcriptional activator CmpR [Labrenzia sp. THAF82]|uniref:LysR substrate-binding domain-containing protein n=1 Tax=Labrenzia sp. THAF82 TaxID=2587861 RepID=UPI0012A8091D|nr:LysR family transcriptional regulator [Labrenzia sp. THAF82]QFT31621.1 HTH-type transcriptional activator CmpR [Labrenzia sp. THAF82]